MKRISLKSYLFIMFATIFILFSAPIYQNIKISITQLSSEHISDVAELHQQLISNNVNFTIYQIEAVANEISNIEQLDINNIPVSLINFISSTFTHSPALTNVYIYNSKKHGINLKNVNGEIEATFASNSFINDIWKTTQSYTFTDEYLYLSRSKNSNLKVILQISTSIFFETTDHQLVNKPNVGFYLYDYKLKEIIYSDHVPTPLSYSQLQGVLHHKHDTVSLDGSTFTAFVHKLNNSSLYFVSLIPKSVINHNFNYISNNLFNRIIFYILLAIIIIYISSSYISNRLVTLFNNAEKIQNFQFNQQQKQKSIVKEIDNINNTLISMDRTIHDILKVIFMIAKTDNLFQLGTVIDNKIHKMTLSRSHLFVISKDNKLISVEGDKEIPIQHHKKAHFIDNNQHYFNLHNDKKRLIGCLIIAPSSAHKLSKHELIFIERLIQIVAISINKHNLLEQQKALFTAFTQSIASAIDTKSTHTANHCQRVPELTLMLAKAAQKNQSEWNDFSLSEQEWEELYLAAWLHDCGKLTTADHVIDKATKLDMFTNRIHEIRTRYEVLKRDAEITYLKKLIDDKSNATLLQENYLRTIKELDEEFAFIAQSNLGDEFYHDDNIDRLHSLATRTFTRTLDKRLGLSWEETQLLSDSDKQTPSIETVLQNNSSHLIPWDLNRKTDEQFNLQPHPFKFNHGEIYNLAVQRGTLTNEERFLINDHIIQTINMLKALPYPDHLKNIPLIAGGHHEQMSGKGYPYGIPASELPITARMMAIADIFEALTASDRPYKTPKKLSESLKILAFMAKNKHIDASLFSLFLTDEVYLNYADKFLSSEQIDDVNIQELIEIAYS
ncbi:HD domain-containing phosphohydrolase [Aliivibrio fischeri]|uniref:Membrane protein n=1 Tax=Aliivibrio fischeri SR5 TaxID=1088719 RepID=A0AAV3ESM9_ALIFS|nr:HD domain-containing phosphohydrolase [Aliivibrio fischeri]EHN69956.1 membrane protein [Aliivibrio fischeri SR5]